MGMDLSSSFPGRVGEDGGHVSVDEAGGHQIDRDVAAGQFLGDGLAHADEPGLAGGIVGLTGIAPQAHHAGEIDNAAVALLHHGAVGGLHAEKGALEVGVHHGVELLLLHLEGQLVFGDARVIDQDVQGTEGLDDRLDHGVHLPGAGDVGPDGKG